MARSALVVVLTFVSGTALAHSWYDQICCSDSDCAPIPTEAVHVVPGGYEVTLRPGDHPYATRANSYFIREEDARPSQDGGYHACLHPPDTMRCFYRPFPSG
jgi:hypothetical protein